MSDDKPYAGDSYRPPLDLPDPRGWQSESFEDPEARRSEGIIPQYPGTDHASKFHTREGDWRSPSETTDLRCEVAVQRLLSSALAWSLGISNPAEFGALHGAAYDLVHDAGIEEEADAREQLMSLIERMASPPNR
jgi:hypothetical protein